MTATKNLALWHLIAGIIMSIAGVYIWFNPLASMVALAVYMGIVFIIVGFGYINASFTFRSGWYLAVGILDLFAGIVFIINDGVAALSLSLVFGLWCLAVGVIQVVTSFQLKKYNIPSNRALGAGVLGVLFGFWILVYPSVGAITITFLMGTYVFLYGVVQIAEYIYDKNTIVQN